MNEHGNENVYHIGNMDCAGCAKEVETGVGKLSGVQSVQVDFMSGEMRLVGDIPFTELQKRVEALGKSIDDPRAAKSQEAVYHVGNMDCAGCAKEVETGVGKLSGVQSVQVDFMSGEMRLVGDVAFTELQKRVEALGKTLEAPQASASIPEKAKRGGVIGFWDHLTSRRETQLALAGGAILLLTVIASLIFALPETLTNAIYTLGMVIALLPIAKSGLTALWINHQFSINFLMSIAAVGAVIIGEYLEGATVIFLFAIGESLESYTADRARQSIASLMSLKPATAMRLNEKGETRVPVEALIVGDQILVKPGEAIPMDGRVLTGASGVNQAPITGESVPVTKTVDETVYAGTINGEGTLTIEVTALAADNTLNRIIKMVQEAQSERAPSQRMIDQFANWYTPAVVVLAALVAFVPPLIFGQPFYDTATEHGWLYRALAMLVIACPCALVISTPVTVISAITAAARRGVLIKGGKYLESLGQVRAFAFDKTGTLTAGKPKVVQYQAVNCDISSPCNVCDDVLALASAVERRASHPLADAVVEAATERDLNTVYAAAENVETLTGRGVRGQVGEHTITIGSHGLFDQEFPHSADLCAQIANSEKAGETTMLLADDKNVRGYISLVDVPRSSSKDVIAQLNALDTETVMLTGDNIAVAEAVGAAVGVSDVQANLLPQDKVTAVTSLRDQHQYVAMVGDGINDTPALAAATVGIAMGGAGSPQALETADIALMADDLTQLPFAVKLSRFARSLIRQNVVLSFGVKFVFLLLALFGLTSLWIAILADVGMALLVTLNGMRPLRFKA